jgi:hypothetical protein
VPGFSFLCGRLDSWWNLCTQRDNSPFRPEIHLTCRQGGPRSPPPLTPQQQALAQELAAAIRLGTDDLVTQIARTLAATTAATLFGDTELRRRDRAHRIAARAYALHLRGKKPATTGLACPCPSRK